MQILSAGARMTVALASFAAVSAPVPIAARQPDVIEACVNPGNGALRVVEAGVACRRNEKRIQWNVKGPAGPQGVPSGAAGGGPYTWICTPASYPNASGTPRADIYVFNGSSTVANVAVHILDRSGNNLAGITIPGSSPSQAYPGETGSTTVAVQPSHTRVVTWATPQSYPEPYVNVAFTVRIVSDKPIAVGSNFQFSGFIPLPCSPLPR